METPEKSNDQVERRAEEAPSLSLASSAPLSSGPSPGDLAVQWFEAGFNCAEAAVLALLPDCERSASLLRAATGFGGGIARHGLTCGAISGAALAVGSLLGRTSADDQQGKERAYQVIDAVIRRFEERYGTVQCHRLTGFDFIGPYDEQEFLTKVKPMVCVPLLRFAVDVTIEELRKAGCIVPGRDPSNAGLGSPPAPPQAA